MFHAAGLVCSAGHCAGVSQSFFQNDVIFIVIFDITNTNTVQKRSILQIVFLSLIDFKLTFKKRFGLTRRNQTSSYSMSDHTSGARMFPSNSCWHTRLLSGWKMKSYLTGGNWRRSPNRITSTSPTNECRL